MITRKSSSKPHTLLPKALTIQIPIKVNQPSPKIQSEPHRIRKNNQIHSPKMVKIQNALDNLQFDLMANSRAEATWNALISSSQKQASSYLAYKMEQSALKLMHSNKASLLKNRVLIYRQSPEARERQLANSRKTKRYCLNGPQRKISFITLKGFKDEQQQKDNHRESRNRKIYMKTAQGKRQKIYQHQYFSKMQEKSQSQYLYSVESVQVSSQREKNLHRISPNFQKSGSTRERFSFLRHIRTKSLKKNILQVPVDDCRPWSSNKSQFPNIQQ